MTNPTRTLLALAQATVAALLLTAVNPGAVFGEPIRHYMIESAILDADFDRAIWLLGEATDQGTPKALFLEGLVRSLEYSPHYDQDEAVRLLRLSANKGFDEASLLLGFLFLGGDDDGLLAEGLTELEGAETSFPGFAALGRALILLALDRDHSEISRLADIAHNHKVRLSNTLVGTLYWGGIGRERNLSKARRHLGADAKSGFDMGQLLLGRILIGDACTSQTGTAAPKDLKIGMVWIAIASLQDHSDASEYLKTCEDRFGKEISETALLDARQWFIEKKQHVNSDIALAMAWCEKKGGASPDCQHLSFNHDLECMTPLATVFSNRAYRETGIYAACRKHHLNEPN